jgi:hypothetical protein
VCARIAPGSGMELRRDAARIGEPMRGRAACRTEISRENLPTSFAGREALVN